MGPQMKISRTQYLLISAVIILVCSVAMSTTLTAFLVNTDKALMLTLTFREHTSFDMFWYYYTNLSCWIPLISILLFTFGYGILPTIVTGCCSWYL